MQTAGKIRGRRKIFSGYICNGNSSFIYMCIRISNVHLKLLC